MLASMLIILIIIADIFNNLHGQVGKTAVVKGLTSLHERGEISGKAYGKQWVYVARQDILPTPSTEELDQLDAKIEELKAQLTSQKEATKQAQARKYIGVLRRPLCCCRTKQSE